MRFITPAVWQRLSTNILPWRRLGLLARLLVLVGVVIAFGAIAVLFLFIKYGAGDALEHLKSEGLDTHQVLLPVLAEETDDRRYSSIHALLTNYVDSDTEIASLRWSFLDGVTLVVNRQPRALTSPGWFISLTGLDDIHSTQSIPLSGGQEGTLSVVVSKAEAENRLWAQFSYLVRSLVMVIALVFVTIAIILKNNVQVIRELAQHANRFRRGDYTTRIAARGAPELQAAGEAFNCMAEKTEKLLKSLSDRGAELTAQLHFTHQLVEALPMPMYYLDKRGCLMGANHAWCKMFGVDLQDSKGKQAKDIYSGCAEFARQQQEKDALLLSNGVDQLYESRFRDKKGKQHYLLMAKTVFTGTNDYLAGAICSIVDLTERRAAEKEKRAALLEKARAEQASETKSRFLSNMSHEMRTPLTAIIGLAETLFDKEKSEVDRINSTQTIIRAGRHLSQLINDLLDLSKVEAGKLQLDMQPVSIVEIIEDVRRLLSSQADNKGVYFVVEYGFPLPESTVSDPLRLKQVLLNLVSNAIKFTERGGVTLSVIYQQDQSRIQIDVRDTGIGITEQQAKKLFSPFSQADASTSRKYGGTGLGLYLSRKLCQMLGGDISLESKAGEGSCFSVSLELDKEASVALLTRLPDHLATPSVIPLETQAEGDVVNLCGHVLLVEDSQDNQELVSHLLKKRGLTLDIASNGEEAVRLAGEREYDVILMDVQMPIMDGIEAVKRLRAQGCTTPVVALTANGSAEEERRCRQAGCDAFLQKPIDHKAFYSVLRAYSKTKDTELDEQPILSSLLEFDPDFHDLVEKFVDRLPGMISDIEKLVQQDKVEGLGAQIHMLKGVGGNMGFPMITHIAQEMENRLQSNRLHDIDSLITHLKGVSQKIELGINQ